MLLSDIFVGISADVDMPTSLYTYGVIISKKAVNSKYMIILGIDTHTQPGTPSGGYDLFLLTKITEQQIYQIAGGLIADKSSWQKMSENNYNLGTLIYKVFKQSGLSRLDIACKYFGIKTIQDYKTKLKPIDQIIEIFKPKT